MESLQGLDIYVSHLVVAHGKCQVSVRLLVDLSL